MWDNGNRAQTPIDFTVGAGVFLLTLAFVIAFVPTLFDPFSAAATASPVVSDRVAAGVAGDLLAASPAETGRAVASLYGRLSQRERDARKRG